MTHYLQKFWVIKYLIVTKKIFIIQTYTTTYIYLTYTGPTRSGGTGNLEYILALNP